MTQETEKASGPIRTEFGDAAGAMREVGWIKSDTDRELLAAFIMECGFATGHGDTVADLIAEFRWQFKEWELRLGRAERLTPGAVNKCEKCGGTWYDWAGCDYEKNIPNKDWARRYCPINKAIEQAAINRSNADREATGADEIEHGHARADAASHAHWKRS